MTKFSKYMHIERLGRPEVAGLIDGRCYVFPKLDGTNASVWLENGKICAGSRNKKLSLDNDNQGFCQWVHDSAVFNQILNDYPFWTIFGEWLVPHTLKNYQQAAWNKFYIFDIYDHNRHLFLTYDVYKLILDSYRLVYIPCQAVVDAGDDTTFCNLLQQNTYLMQANCIGEGIVIKNYNFVNDCGHTVWAKIVRSEFKARPSILKDEDQIENIIVNRYVTETLVQKELAKIINQPGPVQPRLLQTVYCCLVKEELWFIIKKFKNPIIDFKKLSRLTTHKVKQLVPELFS